MTTKKHKQGKHTPFSHTVLQNALGNVYALHAKTYPFYLNLGTHLSNRANVLIFLVSKIMPSSCGMGDRGSAP